DLLRDLVADALDLGQFQSRLGVLTIDTDVACHRRGNRAHDFRLAWLTRHQVDGPVVDGLQVIVRIERPTGVGQVAPLLIRSKCRGYGVRTRLRVNITNVVDQST